MKILIAGIGAIGSNLTARLASDLKGEHEITVLDKDVVEERNVEAGTQYYTADQISVYKVEALQFNIYKNYSREIGILNGEIKPVVPFDAILKNPDLIIDCFDNYRARRSLQLNYENTSHPHELLHIGFSDQFTFAIEWAKNYKVPSDITSGMDICTLEGASAFVNVVASMGALVAERFILHNEKLEILGGKYEHRLIK